MKRNIYEISLTAVCLSCLVISNYPRTQLITTIISFYMMFLLSLWLTKLISPFDFFSSLIVNQQERRRIRFALVTMINLCLLSAAFEPHLETHGFKVFTKQFYWLNNNFGWTACIVLGFSFLLLPSFKLLRINGRIDKYLSHLKNLQIHHNEFELKAFVFFRKTIVFLSKQLRKWHVLISLFGMLFVFYHTYLALVSGFKWNYTYLSGYAALLDLLLLSILGLLRYKKADKNLHKSLAYVLIALLTLHVVFSELRL